MIVKASIAGVFGGAPVVARGVVVLGDRATLADFFKCADKALGLKRPGYFRHALRQRPMATVLLNGNRVDLPEGLALPLDAGDEVSVIAPVAWG